MNVISSQGSCARIRPLLDGYVSNELLTETNAEIQRHLDLCTECAGASESRLRGRNLLRRSVSTIEAGPELRARILGQMEAPQKVAEMPRRSKPPRLAIAAAAAFCLMSALGAYWWERRHAQADSLLEVGWINHRDCTLAGHYPDETPSREVMLTKLGPDYRQMLTVADQRLGDYRIRQGHRCTHNGREYAHLVLQRGVALVSLAILRKTGNEQKPWQPRQEAALTGLKQGISIAGYDTGRHLVFVMSNESISENERLAEGVAPPLRSMLQRY